MHFRFQRRYLWLAFTPLLLGACGTVKPAAGPTRPVNDLYAGSLAKVNEGSLGPAFTRQTGYRYQGQGMGALGAARLIASGEKHPDLFQSLGTAPVEKILETGSRPLASWYVPFAKDELVIAYSPASRFAADFRRVSAGNESWYQLLGTPGLRLGRTNPQTDPQGQYFLEMLSGAASVYKDPTLPNRILANSQIFQEASVLSRLQSGQMDASSAYRAQAIAWGLPYLTLPAAINFGDPSLAKVYAGYQYTLPGHVTIQGKPIELVLTVPNNAPNPRGGLALARFILSPAGQGIYRQAGYGSVEPVLVGQSPSPATVTALGLKPGS